MIGGRHESMIAPRAHFTLNPTSEHCDQKRAMAAERVDVFIVFALQASSSFAMRIDQ